MPFNRDYFYYYFFGSFSYKFQVSCYSISLRRFAENQQLDFLVPCVFFLREMYFYVMNVYKFIILFWLFIVLVDIFVFVF